MQPDRAPTCDMSVIIVNWNTRDLLAACLATLPAAGSGLTVETIVVDNGSSDGSVEMVQSAFPWVRLVETGANLGFARANNVGIRMAQGRFLFLLNSDTLLPPGCLASLVAFAERVPRAGIVAPRLAYPDGGAQPSWAAFPTLASELRGSNIRRRWPVETGTGRPAFATDWVMGAALLCRRDFFANVGLFDEGFFMYSEETDLCMRARRQGWLVCLVDDVTVVHVGGGSASRNNLRQLHLLYENKIRWFARHRGPVRAGLLRVLLVLAILFGIARRELLRLVRSDQSEATRANIRVRRQLLRDLASGRVAQTVNVPPAPLPASVQAARSRLLQLPPAAGEGVPRG